jgi:hypothetical protein
MSNLSATKLSGSFATVETGTTPAPIYLKSWDANIEVKAADVSCTSQNAGFTMKAPLNQSATVSLEGEYDSTQPITTSALGLAPGSYVTNLVCSLSQASAAPIVTLPSALVTKVSIKSVVDTIITYTVDVESNGEFSYNV